MCSSISFNLGFIGGGNMSTAIFKGIIKDRAHPVSKIYVSGPRLTSLAYWKDEGAHVTDKNSEVYNICEIIFLGVKVDMLEQAVSEMADGALDVTRRRYLVSMLAGKSIETLKKVCSKYLPDAEISVIRIMPNTPMTVGVGICLYTPDETVEMNTTCMVLERLLKSCALCERVSEKLLNALGVLTACGPAYMYLVIEALADGAVKQGVPRALAQRHAAQLMVGSGQMVLQSGKHPGLLKDEVCSPGGSTICGVSELENGKIRAAFINAIEASTLKTKDLGK